MGEKSRVICIKNCDCCGKDIEIRHKKRLEYKHLFCSRKCEAEFRKANNPNYIPCVVCGKLTYKKPYQQKESKTKNLCCSMECLAELRKTLYLGENNPNYGNTGINSPLHKKDVRFLNGYKLIPAEGHPFAIDKFWIREHRYVAEKYLMTPEQSVTIGR